MVSGLLGCDRLPDETNSMVQVSKGEASGYVLTGTVASGRIQIALRPASRAELNVLARDFPVNILEGLTAVAAPSGGIGAPTIGIYRLKEPGGAEFVFAHFFAGGARLQPTGC